MLTQNDLHLIRQLLEASLQPIEKRLAKVEDKLNIVEVKLDQSIKDNTDFFIEAGNFFDKMEHKLLQRIERIEDHVGL